jgi:hypothetical protein
MKVSMDGLRRNLASGYVKTIDGFREVTEGRELCDGFDQLKEGLDEMRQMIVGLMCCYSEDPDDLMTDMSDEADKLPFADPAEDNEEEG